MWIDLKKKNNHSIRKNAANAKWTRRNDTCKSRESQQVCVSASRENRSLFWCFCLRKSSLRELNYTLVRKCRIWITTVMLMDHLGADNGNPWGVNGSWRLWIAYHMSQHKYLASELHNTVINKRKKGEWQEARQEPKNSLKYWINWVLHNFVVFRPEWLLTYSITHWRHHYPEILDLMLDLMKCKSK